MKAEHRRDKRSRVFLSAFLRTADGDSEVKLTNLSGVGACAEYPVVLAPGSEVQVSRGDIRVPARIAWAAEGKIGIEFVEALDVNEFRTQGRTSANSHLSDLHKPVEKLSPRLERHWAKILSQ